MPHGRLQIGMTVTALDGVKRFVMQYGFQVRVLAPEAVRIEPREKLSQSLKIEDV
ncbi:MAG: WYL domain-containing protein [Acidobacteriota bacterium]